MITQADLTRGARFAVPNQTTAITPSWKVVEVVTHDGVDIWYHCLTSVGERCGFYPTSTPIDRFLDIVNAPAKGPHHAPRPRL